MRNPIDIVVLEEEKVNDLKPMIFEYFKNGYELVGQIQYSPENAYRCDAYVATMIKYEQCEQIEDNKMRTAKDIEYKLKELHLDLQSLGMSWSNGDCNKEYYKKARLVLYSYVDTLNWILNKEEVLDYEKYIKD